MAHFVKTASSGSGVLTITRRQRSVPFGQFVTQADKRQAAAAADGFESVEEWLAAGNFLPEDRPQVVLSQEETKAKEIEERRKGLPSEVAKETLPPKPVKVPAVPDNKVPEGMPVIGAASKSGPTRPSLSKPVQAVAEVPKTEKNKGSKNAKKIPNSPRKSKRSDVADKE